MQFALACHLHSACLKPQPYQELSRRSGAASATDVQVCGYSSVHAHRAIHTHHGFQRVHPRAAARPALPDFCLIMRPAGLGEAQEAASPHQGRSPVPLAGLRWLRVAACRAQNTSKGQPRKKIVSKASSAGTDQKVAAALKKLSVQPLSLIEEANFVRSRACGASEPSDARAAVQGRRARPALFSSQRCARLCFLSRLWNR
jgi:hypothetical protein